MKALLNPFFLSDRALRQALSKVGGRTTGFLLDIGCGWQPYRTLFPLARYFGLEVRQAGNHGSQKFPNAWFDGFRIPFRDASVEHAMSTQVIEHVFDPDRFLSEIARVLADGGTFLVSAPFVWDEHEQPFDFARYSSFGLRALAARHGFAVIEAERTLPDASVFVQLWLAYLYKIALPLPRPLRRSLLAGLSLVGNPFGLAIGKLLPSSPDFYLDNVMLWKKLPAAG